MHTKQSHGALGHAKLKFEAEVGLFSEWDQQPTFNNDPINSELADAYQLQAETAFEELVKHPYTDSIDTSLHPDD